MAFQLKIGGIANTQNKLLAQINRQTFIGNHRNFGSSLNVSSIKRFLSSSENMYFFRR
jgi:hypothetical protein